MIASTTYRDTYRRSAVQGTDSSSELSLGERIVVTSIAGKWRWEQWRTQGTRAML